MRARRLVVWPGLLLLWACHDFDAAGAQCVSEGRCLSASGDAGAGPGSDAGARDGGAIDAGESDAGSPDAGPCIAPDAGEVTGTDLLIWVSEVSIDTSPAVTTIGAFVDEPCVSGVTYLGGTIDAGGQFDVLDVPFGSYLLATTGIAYETQLRNVDLSATVLGRATQTAAPAGSTLRLQLTGLNPWNDADGFVVAAPNAGLYSIDVKATSGPGFASGGPDAGDVALAAAVIDLSGFPVIDGNSGDSVYAYQVVLVDAGSGLLAVSAVAGGVALAGPVDAGQSSASLTFQSLPQASVARLWDGNAFDQMALQSGPNASLDLHTVQVVAEPPSLSAPDHVSEFPYLARTVFFANQGTVPFTLSYGSIFPSSWIIFGWSLTVATVHPFPGSDAGVSVPMLSAEDLTSWGVGGTLEPLVTPPLAPMILPGGPTTTPVVSWSPPTRGQPDFYLVTIARPGASSAVLSVFTTGTSIHLPPGKLTVGQIYLVTVSAGVAGGWDPAKPLQVGLPFGVATAMLEAYTP